MDGHSIDFCAGDSSVWASRCTERHERRLLGLPAGQRRREVLYTSTIDHRHTVGNDDGQTSSTVGCHCSSRTAWVPIGKWDNHAQVILQIAMAGEESGSCVPSKFLVERERLEPSVILRTTAVSTEHLLDAPNTSRCP
jgi:hypothetical protein